MKKFFICICVMMIAFVVFANMQMFSPQDAKQIGIVTNILWKTTPLEKEDLKHLLKIVQYQHDDVAAYALSAAVACEADNLSEIIKHASESQNYNTRRVAVYVAEIGNGNIIKTIENDLTGKKLLLYHMPYPERYVRDILVYSLLRQVRRKNMEVPIPDNIEFSWKQRMLLKFADKPENQAWEYLFPLLAEQQGKGDTAFAVILALSAYSKIFFDEAAASIKSTKTSKLIKEILIDYLSYNQYRLNEDQLKKFEGIKNFAKISTANIFLKVSEDAAKWVMVYSFPDSEAELCIPSQNKKSLTFLSSLERQMRNKLIFLATGRFSYAGDGIAVTNRDEVVNILREGMLPRNWQTRLRAQFLSPNKFYFLKDSSTEKIYAKDK